MTTIDLTRPDGRVLEVLVGGDPDGFPFVFHGGQPSAAVAYPPFDTAARDAGLRLVTTSRPGYGRSTPRPGYRVVDDVADTLAVLDHLGLGDFVTAGLSGGGPRALACAALTSRCRAAASIAGIAPRDTVGLDWFTGMAPENLAEYTAAAAGSDEYGAYLEREFLPVLQATADDIADSLGELVTAVDRAAITGELAEWLARTFHHAAAQGVVGMRDDGLALTSAWGFDLASVAAPVAVWQGDQDAMVPFAHGAWLAEHVPGARAHLVPGEGHLSIMERVDDILADLRSLAGLSR